MSAMAGTVSKKLVPIMALGTFVVVLDNTIMNVSISALVADLHTTVSGVQAAISLNALMMAAFVLMGGKLADIIGMKRAFVMGAVIYISGSLLASLSNNITIFILGWCLIQGFGAALMLPNVTTIIRANLKGKERAQAYGTMAGINALGMAVGPLIGGFLTTYFSWRWAFRLEVFVLIIVLLSRNVIPKDVLGKMRPKLDKFGVAWQAAAMIFIVVGILMISTYGLLLAKQPFMIGDFAFEPFGLSIVPFVLGAGLLCLLAFVRHENRISAQGKDTLVNLKLFGLTQYVKGLGVRFTQTALVAGTTFAVPLFLQVTFNLSAFETGGILLGMTAGMLITALGGTRAGMQYLPKQKVRWGFLICILGLGILAAYVYAGDSPGGIVPGLFIYGLGLGLIASQIVNLIMSVVDPKQTAEAAGVTSTLDTLGSSVGTAVIGTVLVFSLTGGIDRMVNQSTVFSAEAKTQISQDITGGVEVVSSQVLSDEIQENGEYEEEAIRIYDDARQNAFIITLLFMAFVALVAYIVAKDLPNTKTVEDAGV